MLIKCTMREGITEADIEGYRYTFRPDTDGNPICSVTKQGHIDEILRMGKHCYVEFVPELPVEQMSAEAILASPDGVYEDEKAEVLAAREKASNDAEAAATKKTAAIKDKKAEIQERKKAPEVKQSAAAGLAEAKIEELINQFRPLTVPKFKEWIDINRDLIPTMPADVKAALAKKILAKMPGQDPDITGFNLESYVSTNPTDKGHSNNE